MDLEEIQGFRPKIDITSILILVSGAGIVSLGGTADASKLATGDPNKARKALDGSIRRLARWGSIGAGWWYCGKQVHKVHANKVHIVHDFKASQNDRYDFKDTKCLTENSNTESCSFVKLEVAFHTTLSCEYVCIEGTKFLSKAIIMNFVPYRKTNSNDFHHSHNGFYMHKNNGANIAIPLGFFQDRKSIFYLRTRNPYARQFG